MRISHVRREPGSGGASVLARVTWEDADREPQDLFVSARPPHDADLAATTSFPLTAAAWPAFHAGERRIAVEGTVCPRLRDGLTTVLRMMARWTPSSRRVPVIEATGGFVAERPAPVRRTGMFLSGGVDSLDLLLDNRGALPRDHPLAVRDAFFVHGLDIGVPGRAPRAAFYERARRAIEPICARHGVALVPLATNVRTLDSDGKAWALSWFGSATVALAHAFAPPLTDLLFASSLDVEGLTPVGSHPMTDPYLSSAALAVHHEGVHRSRLEKLRRVTERADAFAALRVCWQEIEEDGPLNCGRCRKCVRTMLGLEALGRLSDAPTFPRREVSTADLGACEVDPVMVRFYEELVGPLDARGRDDLAAALRERLRAFRAGERPRGRGPWLGLRRILRRR